MVKISQYSYMSPVRHKTTDEEGMTKKAEKDYLIIKADTLKILIKKGHGSFGEVYQAESTRWGTVAYKRLDVNYISKTERYNSLHLYSDW